MSKHTIPAQKTFYQQQKINRIKRLMRLNINYLNHIQYQVQNNEQCSLKQERLANRVCISMEKIYHKLDEIQYYLKLQQNTSSRSRL